MGTHYQLGMAACGFLERTDVPCMTCGMTTSFSALAHGQLRTSLWAQPAGTIYAVVTAMLAVAGLYAAWTGLPSARMLRRLPLTGWMLTLLAIGAIGWAYKIVMVVRASRYS